jgi:hypothetical protein
MTPEEINELLDSLIENFRAFVVEELQRHYDAGRTVSSEQVKYLLKMFEDNEMVKMFNEDKIPQDGFRIFLQKYLRLWFEMFAEKIDEANGKIIQVDDEDDLPTDGSAIVAVVNNELYFFDGGAWRKACDYVPGEIPTFDSLDELPDDGSIDVAVINGDLYYFNGNEWVKVVTEQELNEAINNVNKAISNVYENIASYVNSLLGGNSFKDKGKTYHDAVLQIADTVPAMSEGERCLVNIVEEDGAPAVVVENVEVLQNAMFSNEVQFSTTGNLYAIGDTVLTGIYILHNNLSKYVEDSVFGMVEFNGKVYCSRWGSDLLLLYKFNSQSREYESVTAAGDPVFTSRRAYSDYKIYPFDGKLWFNSPVNDKPRWSYIDSGEQVTLGAPLNGVSPSFDIGGAVIFQNKLHIGGDSGLWTLGQGQTVPQHVTSALFDSAPVVPLTVFDGKLWLQAGGGIVSYDGIAITEYPVQDTIPLGAKTMVWDGELHFFNTTYDSTSPQKVQGNSIVSSFGWRTIFSVAVWNDKIWLFGKTTWQSSLGLYTIDKSHKVEFLTASATPLAVQPDGSLLVCKTPSGSADSGGSRQIIVERHTFKTIGGGSGNTVEIKIVGMNADGQYDEPFGEGHRVVVRDSPTGFSREYGVRDGKLIDTDGDDNAAIRGNVDTYAALLAIDTSDINLGIKVGDGMIVEQDESHAGNSAIYTWDGTNWNFTHLWEISLELKYGTYTVSSSSFTFNKFAAKNENSEEFDVLEVSLGASVTACSVNVAATSGKLGDTRIMIFNVGSGQTVNLSFGFAYKLVDGGELILTQGMHVVSMLRASISIVNIAPYE